MNRKTHSLIPNLLCVSGSWSQCMRERGRRLSMNRERKVRPHPACAAEAASARRRPGPLPRGEGEALWRIRRSWSQCMCERKLRLAMNRKTHSLISNLLCVSGSWSQ